MNPFDFGFYEAADLAAAVEGGGGVRGGEEEELHFGGCSLNRNGNFSSNPSKLNQDFKRSIGQMIHVGAWLKLLVKIK
ncbi:hypothetical protein LIER_41878 [Lithospermum erythrorhizon]|uniref:Uncharacterized protein n=1 Tax=Lithospermum erythrorhizon TaxID=34254 RepID=A0AAV3RG68_LITER